VRIPRVVARLLLVATGMAAAVLVLEVVMTLAEPMWTRTEFLYDRELGFRIRPHFRGSNEFGFNDRDYPRPKPAGVQRVVFVGDSFSWAGGRNANYTAILERAFAHDCGAGKVDVVNAGYPMTHTGEQRLMLQRYGLQYQPDLVVLAFFVGNDVADAIPNRKRIVVNDVLLDVDASEEWTLFGRPVVARSRLFAFLRQRWIAWTATEAPPPPWPSADVDLDAAPVEEADPAAFATEPAALLGYLRRLPDPDVAAFTEDAYFELIRNKAGFFDRKVDADGWFADRWGQVFASIDAIRALLDPRGIRLVVLLIPDELQVDDQLLSQAFAGTQERREQLGRIDVELPQRRLRERLGAQGVTVIDPLEEFRRVHREVRLYMRRNTHWNHAGNHLAAAILRRELQPLLPR
jgi:hypothetical protein